MAAKVGLSVEVQGDDIVVTRQVVDIRTSSTRYCGKLKLAQQGQDQNYYEDETNNSRRTIAPGPAVAPGWKNTD
jgi:hypothetical protein